MKLTTELVILWLRRANDAIQENQEYLTELDQIIGDGDHGINMARGFQAALEHLNSQTYETPGAVLKDVAMVLLSKIGGAAGPLYASALLKMAATMRDEEAIAFPLFQKAIDEAVKGLQHRGKSVENEKTLIDVWAPFAQYLSTRSDWGMEEWSNVLTEAKNKTKAMQATKGRAAYYKEKSIGHLDAGATSSYYLLMALMDVLKEQSI
ncbi:dihydroxyacetone kinase subunit DhaL [Bacillus sp. REN10]|uniref:dihydroxyacetone kinase subunit DhaL n=1 Tax=Bacillus sp. REN10 TaxID=2782541 RepID=UPI00193BC57C|nr:dihydroxyacetone kinase subunit DhaL [Bacillus sp. REN10]